jgi:SAM-dependent methyltransferase
MRIGRCAEGVKERLDVSSSARTMLRALGKVHGAVVFSRRVDRIARAVAAMIPEGARTLLDVGAGSGDVARAVAARRPGLSASGVDVLVRPGAAIPVVPFDGVRLPFPDGSHDVVLLADVLHHAADPGALLADCARVAARRVIVKDHVQRGAIDRLVLRFMDWVGNAPHGVRLEYRYFDDAEWTQLSAAAGLRLEERTERLGLYPFPASLVFGRRLHFVAALRPEAHRQRTCS